LKTHGETDGQNPDETKKKKQFQVSISLFSCFVLHTVDCLVATSREKNINCHRFILRKNC
jgi:hypothetical protein